MAITDIITPIVTILGSGIVAALVSSSLNEGKERWQIRRQKAEELFKNSDRYIKDLNSYHMSNMYYFTGKFNRNQLNDMIIKDNKPTEDFRDLQMNIYLYEPKLIDAFNHLVQKRTALNSIASICSDQRADKDRVTGAALTNFQSGWDELSLACDRLRDEIIAIGRGIAEEGTQAERMIVDVRSRVERAATKAHSLLTAIRRTPS